MFPRVAGLIIEPADENEREACGAFGPPGRDGIALFVPPNDAAQFLRAMRPAAVRAAARLEQEQPPPGSVFLLVLTATGDVHTMSLPVAAGPVRGQA